MYIYLYSMNKMLLMILAFSGGVFLAAQSALNTHLGVLLKNPILATLATSISGTIFTSIIILLGAKTIPNLITIKQVPWYLWFLGGLFSVIGVSIYFYSIPKLGIFKMLSLGLCGQLILSIIAGHFGWLSLPIDPITVKKIIGIISLIAGILLINLK